MAKKMKRISVNAFEKAAQECMDENIMTGQWNGVEIEVKKRLSLVEMMSFVKEVAEGCFADETGEYMPEVKDFAVRCSVLERYANFTLPANIEKKYELVYSCDAYNFVLSLIDQDQFESIMQAIDERTDAKIQANTEAFNKQVHEFYATLDELAQRFSAMFDGVNPEDLASILGAVKDGQIDEGRMMEAYLKASAERDTGSQTADEAE